MSDTRPQPELRYVYDFYRRPYRIGESDRDILGYSRRGVARAAWAAMLAVSVMQYGYAALIPGLARDGGWGLVTGLWALALLAACQAAAVVPAAWLRRNRRVPPSAVTAAGAVLCAAALVVLAHGDTAVAVLLGYAVLGGVGSGLVYGTCIGVVAAWYPERPATVAAVSGAFCYGAIPLVLVATRGGALPLPIDASAVALLVVAGGCAFVLGDPPAHWWPRHLDPRRWSLDSTVNASLRGNRPAIRQHRPAEVLRCRVTGRMYLLVGCVSAMALFDLAYLMPLVEDNELPTTTAAIAIAALAAMCGVGRAPAVHAGHRWGRSRVSATALCLGALAQPLMLAGTGYHSSVLLVVAAGLAGLAAGSCYAVLPGMVLGYFGDSPGLPNFAALYSAKFAGALVGVGVAASTVVPGSYPVGFWVAAVLALAGACTVRTLRKPGLPDRPLPSRVPAPRERARTGAEVASR